jgi:hypothetical protein
MPRAVILGLAAVCVFALVAGIMLGLTPGPLKPFDYMVIGSVATLVALLVLFMTLVKTTKSGEVFFKKRRKPE